MSEPVIVDDAIAVAFKIVVFRTGAGVMVAPTSDVIQIVEVWVTSPSVIIVRKVSLSVVVLVTYIVAEMTVLLGLTSVLSVVALALLVGRIVAELELTGGTGFLQAPGVKGARSTKVELIQEVVGKKFASWN